MLGREKLIAVVTMALMVLMSQMVFADSCAVKLTADDFEIVTPRDETLGKYYLATVIVPDTLDGKELLFAVLDLSVDVSSRNTSGFTNETPIFEVYALTAELGNELDPSKFRTPSSMRRNIRVGENRQVRIDITSVVRDFLNDPSCNHGLVLGSLSNARDGFFEVKAANGQLGTITYYYTAGE